MQKTYSLAELVEEIFGIDEDNVAFESHYKKLQRLDKLIRQNSDFQKTQGISEENRDSYVKFMKIIHNEPDKEEILKKISKGKYISEGEHEKLRDVYFRSKELEVHKELKNKVDNYDKLYSKLEHMQARGLSTLEAIRGYFFESLFPLEEAIFNETLNQLYNITDKYIEEVNKVCEKAKNTCMLYDELDNRIFESMLLKSVSPSVQSGKYNHLYNKLLDKNVYEFKKELEREK